MNGVVYSTKISDPRNGRQTVIMEVWIERIGMCINEINGAFRSNSPRTAINHFGTFNISDPVCTAIREHVEKRESFEAVNAKIFAALKSRLSNTKNQHNRIV